MILNGNRSSSTAPPHHRTTTPSIYFDFDIRVWLLALFKFCGSVVALSRCRVAVVAVTSLLSHDNWPGWGSLSGFHLGATQPSVDMCVCVAAEPGDIKLATRELIIQSPANSICFLPALSRSPALSCICARFMTHTHTPTHPHTHTLVYPHKKSKKKTHTFYTLLEIVRFVSDKSVAK